MRLSAHTVFARRPLYRARKEFIAATAWSEQFGVDAVLPADLGGAPRANRQHTKADPSMLATGSSGAVRFLFGAVRFLFQAYPQPTKRPIHQPCARTSELKGQLPDRGSRR
jgi:hypothetical protein